MSLKKISVGEIRTNRKGERYRIDKINNSLSVIVTFIDRGYTKETQASYAYNGSIRCPKLMVGDIVKDKYGQDVEIIEILNSDNVTFRWSDGYTRIMQSSRVISNNLLRENESKRLNPTVKVGDIYKNKQGVDLVVVNYESSKRITVEVQGPKKHELLVTSGNLKKGYVNDRYSPSAAGVGILGDFPVDVKSKCYRTWYHILKRCYTPHTEQIALHYGDCWVADDWHHIENFGSWIEQQKWEENWHIDKDLLVKGNKVYSENTCCMVPVEINNFLTLRRNHRGLYPVGVTYHERLDKYEASVSENGSPKYLGVYHTADQAFYVYKEYKQFLAKGLASKWEGIVDDKVCAALLKYEVMNND